ncbi:hypothetical protein EC991_002563 [Linnemannia zychae]|nr:hypothetical protein EC991_002563 [Linnemannia zychae]
MSTTNTTRATPTPVSGIPTPLGDRILQDEYDSICATIDSLKSAHLDALENLVDDGDDDDYDDDNDIDQDEQEIQHRRPHYYELSRPYRNYEAYSLWIKHKHDLRAYEKALEEALKNMEARRAAFVRDVFQVHLPNRTE